MFSFEFKRVDRINVFLGLGMMVFKGLKGGVLRGWDKGLFDRLVFF